VREKLRAHQGLGRQLDGHFKRSGQVFIHGSYIVWRNTRKWLKCWSEVNRGHVVKNGTEGGQLWCCVGFGHTCS
jgi:hypothetical protein